MNENRRKNGPGGGLLIIIGICLFLMLVSSFSPSFSSMLRGAASTVLMPMQRGMNQAGSYVFGKIEQVQDLSEVRIRNDQLQEELDLLRQENARLKLAEKEQAQLRMLLMMQEQYPQYGSIGAHIIGKSSGNWFQSFVIDRGEKDGLQVGMNVLAGGGLVGLVTAVGENYSTVTTIINSGHYVSAMGTKDASAFLVAGDLTLYGEGLLALQSVMAEADLAMGDMVVTSNISDVYLPGLLIGYVEKLESDSGQLTRSGTLRPVANFDTLDMVLVILTLKEGGDGP